MIISLYNGFPFHYETFGVFLYCLSNIKIVNEIRIYTNQSETMGWLDFYRVHFPAIHIFHMDEFKQEQFEESTYVIVTTDDDPYFPVEYMRLPGAQRKVFCYDHNVVERIPHFTNHITTRPYNTRRNTPYMYPVFPVVPIEEKRAILAKEETINITVVGGSWNTNHYWQYLLKNNDMTKIKIFFIHRDVPGVWKRMDRYVKSICPQAELYKNCDAKDMMEMLKRSHYIAFLTDIDQFVHRSCSGSVGMAFDTGCTMLMTRKYNTDFAFKNPIYFDDYPVLSREPNLELLYEEQHAILDHNQTVLNSCFTTTVDPK